MTADGFTKALGRVEENDSLIMGNGVKIHMGFAKEVKRRLEIALLKNWPSSSLDLNLIAKVWR